MQPPDADPKEAEIRRAGLKVTAPRLRILELLETTPDEHLSAEAVYRRLLERGEEVGFATVYRVLTQFETAGLIRRHHFESGSSVFEIDRGDHHDHVVCLDCGRVEEFMDAVIEERQHQIAETRGFKLHDHALVLYAHCNREACPHRPSGRTTQRALNRAEG